MELSLYSYKNGGYFCQYNDNFIELCDICAEEKIVSISRENLVNHSSFMHVLYMQIPTDSNILYMH